MLNIVKTAVFKKIIGQISILTLIGSLFLLPLLLAQAAEESLFSEASKRVQQDKPFISEPIDTASYAGLTFAFTYDSTTLDGFATSSGQDSFSYGWRSGSDEHVLGTVLGLAGSGTDEQGQVSVPLPVEASVNDLVLFVEVTANSTSTSDKVELTNISLVGTLQETPPADLCPNIEGNQVEIPTGYELDTEGNCSLIVTEEPTDLCLNLEGVQAEVPTGYENNDGQCTLIPDIEGPVDLCLNLDGVQTTIPEGYEQGEANTCTIIPPPVVDVCSNIAGVQATVPEGYELGTDGICTEITVTPPDPEEPRVCPRGYARWVDKLSNSNIWRADDVYKSVILVARNDFRFGKYSRNFSFQRHIYIPGPTEIGDRYYHRFGKIGYICVK